MSKILIIAELDGHALNSSTAKCVNCASQLDADAIDVAIFSDQCDSAATTAAAISGVSRVLSVESPGNEHALAATFAPQAVA
jgi:electron transfer flavoprotein alpha subunit